MTMTTTPTDQATTRRKTCVLIVDDEADVRESLRDVVEMVGCSAVMAASAEEGLLLLADDRRLCLVVLDLLLPGMTGTEMLAAMRREPAFSKIPVVISTSAPEQAPPGVPVLAKPIDVGALCGWMRSACDCV